MTQFTNPWRAIARRIKCVRWRNEEDFAIHHARSSRIRSYAWTAPASYEVLRRGGKTGRA